MPRDLGERAQDFREQWLAPSGGWLSELVVTLSDLTGIWDIIILSGVFVGSWIILRTSPMEISLILGFGFDLAIPLQYQNDEELSYRHEVHLQNYWRTFIIGCIVEGVSFFLLHPDLFTLIVCIKTTFMLVMWLSKDQEGLQIKPRSSKSGRNEPPNSRSHSHRSSPPDSSSESESDSSRPSRRSSPSKPPSNIPPCKHIQNSYKYLKRAGYEDPAIAGMNLTMNQADKNKAKKMFAGWTKERDPKNIARRNKEYAERARKAGWKPSSSLSSDSDSNRQSGSSNSQMPQSKHVPDAYKYLKRAGYDDPAIAGMILSLNQIGDKEKAEKQFKSWAKEKDPKQIERRNVQYAERAKKAGWNGSSSQPQSQLRAGDSGSRIVDDGPSNMPISYHIPTSKTYQALKKAGYEEPAIAGMIIGMNGSDENQALQNYKIWTEEKDPNQIKRRNQQHGERGKQAGFPDKNKMNAASGGPPSERIKTKLGIPVGSVKKVENILNSKDFKKKIKSEEKKKILDILKNPKSEREIMQVVNKLMLLGINIKQPEFQDGWGSSDGKGGYRDILIRDNDRNMLIKSMKKKGQFSKEEMIKWDKFLRQPFSRRELEETVIPFAKRIDAYIGEGYHGTGPHRFRDKWLQSIKPRIKERNTISTAVLDQAILYVINRKDPSETQSIVDRWIKQGMTKEEIQHFSKQVDWA
ncbi:hypothetical protein L486_04075 [Kwoniella mangroviensis CBS 10435]|uniref:Uncharacterized protein n=1 Tax=Kwoniella mangroviensis CBS 10435 TaxID=1331196 RepID=A0A1B9IRA7_9TREE|nr:hypothetical protein L486_04075 [Kwoniella mangroviensis CBS 10435]